jgi:hypothetical protein
MILTLELALKIFSGGVADTAGAFMNFRLNQ